MRKFVLLLLLYPVCAFAHPPIAIVRDSKGNIFYSDLQQVWKLTNGVKSVAVPGVHTHELFLDRNDNLYGEHLWYEGDVTKKFNHYEWVLHPNGILDTVIAPRQAYQQTDYSLARDLDGNEYYLKLNDATHVYKKPPDGQEVVLATGSFKGVSWLHPQADRSLLYVFRNGLYRMHQNGQTKLLAANLASGHSMFKLADAGRTVWGAWQDDTGNVFVAVFSDQRVKMIDVHGAVTDRYLSPEGWAPIQGIFDNEGKLWVMECSDKNEVRVIQVQSQPFTKPAKKMVPLAFRIAILGVLGCIVIYASLRITRRQRNSNQI